MLNRKLFKQLWEPEITVLQWNSYWLLIPQLVDHIVFKIKHNNTTTTTTTNNNNDNNNNNENNNNNK